MYFLRISTIVVTLLVYFCVNNIAYAYTQPKIIMIDPAGNERTSLQAKNPGRHLHKGYERAETYKCAEALKNRLEKKFNVRVVLTRALGDEIVPLQNASFANRLNVDFFLRINFYIQDAPKPSISLYHVVFDPIIDTVQRTFDPFAFVPIHQAHFKNISQTIKLATDLALLLGAEHYQRTFDVKRPYGLPLKPLIGIVAPALIMEICLPLQDNQWECLIDPIAENLMVVLGITPLGRR